MVNHPIVSLVQKIDLHYSKEIALYWKTSATKRAAKFYKLISQAKNNAQLEKELLFKKLFGKAYSDKIDYLWRNEVRVLKEVLEQFLITIEHQYHSKNNTGYNDWLLLQAYSRLKYSEGVNEKHELLTEQKNNTANYQFALDADFIKLLNYIAVENDLKKILEHFPQYVENCLQTLDNLVAQQSGRINMFIAQYNLICGQHQNENTLLAIGNTYNRVLPQNGISSFYAHYALSCTTDFKLKMEYLELALKDIEPIATHNKMYEHSKIVAQISLGRELSGNGYFLKAHHLLFAIKDSVNKAHPLLKTVFYVNYITNLVKCKMYAEALQALDHEFSEENILYKNMLLQNRLLCYLYLRDVKNFSNYISYDLDAAPFPQNFMLKVIKSAYFYLIQEYDVAITITSNLLQTKDTTDRMQNYQPILLLYKKFYTAAQKNKLLKKWSKADIKGLLNEIEKIEATSPDEIKLVSIYLWIKGEIESL